MTFQLRLEKLLLKKLDCYLPSRSLTQQDLAQTNNS